MGLAAGDALGTTLEFTFQGEFEPVTDMVGGGPFGLEPGQWTDDTSMALCLAESLVEKQAFNPGDQMRRYLRWYQEGYLSSTGRTFDVGNTISDALQRFRATDNPFSGRIAPYVCGNGSLMRLVPVPLAFARDPEEAIRLAGEMSRTTHGAPEPVDACRYYAGLIVGALSSESKEALLGTRFSPVDGAWAASALSPKIDEVAAGSFKRKQPPEIRGTGYVVQTLEAALWAFWNSDDFQEGALMAVNLGEDADTTGAIYGQLAGAYYGLDAIPAKWRKKIAMTDRILDLSDALCAFANPGVFSREKKPTEQPGHLRILEYLDSDAMAESRRRELNILRKTAAELGKSAVEAASKGYYRSSAGTRVDWGDLVQSACASKRSIRPDDPLPTNKHASFSKTRVQVTNETTLGASRRLVEKGLRPLALNFANGVTPGGGFLGGARAQEEVLCRSSALFETLVADPMYEEHRQRPLADSTDWAIYSPDVPVFRMDGGTEIEPPWLLSFITCAAPYAPGVGQPKSGDLLQQRIHRVLAIAEAHGHSSLVLGAWGCGAFENDPKRTAKDFRQALEFAFRGVFSDIVFAVTDWSPERRYLGAFRDEFADNG